MVGPTTVDSMNRTSSASALIAVAFGILTACSDEVPGSPDAGEDAGSGGADAGTSDAGAASDAGVDPDPPPGLLLAIDWTAETGNTARAVTDDSKGITRWCDWESVLSVVPGDSVGLSRPGNALRIQSIASCGHVEFENLFPLPAAGQFWAFRWFTMNGQGQTDSKQHPFCLWPVGAIEMVTQQIFTSGGNQSLTGGQWIFAIGASSVPGNVGQWRPRGTSDSTGLVIEPGEWVRYELIIEWLDSTRYRLHPRLYAADGTLLADTNDWVYTSFPFVRLQDWYEQSPNNTGVRRSDYTDINNIRTPSFGMGQSGSSGGYYYVANAAFAVVSGPTDFIGLTSSP